MAHYAIGDIQGCFDVFQKLLAEIGFSPSRDILWLTGDIVNRGPQSLATLRFVMQNEECMHTVLGNHDLHLLAVAEGAGRLKKNDTIDDILSAPDRDILLHKLRFRPLIIGDTKRLTVHAGLLPEWTTEQAFALAHEAEDVLRSDDYSHFLHNMYGNKPARWRESLSGFERIRLILNVMTRMRVIDKNHKLDFDFKSVYEEIPENLTAWFDVKHRSYEKTTVIFGHWSALGLYRNKNVIGLDTGALWGGELTAINLDTGEITQVSNRHQGLNIKSL